MWWWITNVIMANHTINLITSSTMDPCLRKSILKIYTNIFCRQWWNLTKNIVWIFDYFSSFNTYHTHLNTDLTFTLKHLADEHKNRWKEIYEYEWQKLIYLHFKKAFTYFGSKVAPHTNKDGFVNIISWTEAYLSSFQKSIHILWQ
jgi:hypothetical protein